MASTVRHRTPTEQERDALLAEITACNKRVADLRGEAMALLGDDQAWNLVGCPFRSELVGGVHHWACTACWSPFRSHTHTPPFLATFPSAVVAILTQATFDRLKEFYAAQSRLDDDAFMSIVATGTVVQGDVAEVCLGCVPFAVAFLKLFFSFFPPWHLRELTDWQ